MSDVFPDARWLLGHAFEQTSNFGRSIARPLGCFIAVLFVCWSLYVWQYLHYRAQVEVESRTDTASLTCLPGPKMFVDLSESPNAATPAQGQPSHELESFTPIREHPLIEAIYFTAGRVLIFATDPQDRLAQAQACLFGRFDKASASGPSVGRRALVPNTPRFVSIVAAFQTFVCTILLFLVGLALRNKFKMR